MKTKKFTLYTDVGLVYQEGRDIWDAYSKASFRYRWVRKPNKRGSTSHKSYSRKLSRRLARRYPGIDRRSVKIASGKFDWICYNYGILEFG